ncbi:hypothetical protein [Maritalea sp.]|jgi:hypothetical protein|uniref:hypothetical protein n=1 Tax=Maritalea sp. TaxID=2003361 RepID=UPI0039E482DF
MKKHVLFLSTLLISSLSFATTASANEIRIWDSKDETYFGYRSPSECSGSCNKILEECGGSPLYVGGYAHTMLWKDYNSGGTIYVKLLDDNGYKIRDLCTMGN